MPILPILAYSALFGAGGYLVSTAADATEKAVKIGAVGVVGYIILKKYKVI